MDTVEAKETTIPIVLSVVGALIFLVYGLTAGGFTAAGAIVVALAIWLIVGVGLALLACFLASALLGPDYGKLGPATLKLTAAFLFPTAIGLLIPGIGWLVSLALYLGLIGWLFQLDIWETVLTAILIFLVRLGTGALVGIAVGATM